MGKGISSLHPSTTPANQPNKYLPSEVDLLSKYAQKCWQYPQPRKKFLLCISGADQNPKSLHPLRFTYHECISWLSLFIQNANWHELVFSKKEWSISKKCIKVAEEQYRSRDEIKSHSSLNWVMEMEKSTDKQRGYLKQGSFSLAVFLFYPFNNYSPNLLTQ